MRSSRTWLRAHSAGGEARSHFRNREPIFERLPSRVLLLLHGDVVPPNGDPMAGRVRYLEKSSKPMPVDTDWLGENFKVA